MNSKIYQALSLGVEMAITVIAGALLGQWLDSRFGTAPWLLVLGLGLGSIIGFWNVYKVATQK